MSEGKLSKLKQFFAENPYLYTAAKAARLLGIPERTMYRIAASNDFPVKSWDSMRKHDRTGNKQGEGENFSWSDYPGGVL